MTEQELRDLLEAHGKWFRGDASGTRLDLRGRDLRAFALVLRVANLRGANLGGANLTRKEAEAYQP